MSPTKEGRKIEGLLKSVREKEVEMGDPVFSGFRELEGSESFPILTFVLVFIV